MPFKKTIFSFIYSLLFICTANLSAGIINGISVIVEDEPITLFEIYKYSQIYKISNKEALDLLIRQKLELNQIKMMDIQVSEYEVNQMINDMAIKNNMNTLTFLSALKSENISIDTYKSDLIKKIQRDKLYQYIFGSKMQAISDGAIRAYYNSNKIEFTKVDSFDVTRYQSKNEEDLENTESPDVVAIRLRLESISTESKIINILTKTDIGTFTSTIKNKDVYVKFYLHSKDGESVLAFEEVQSIIKLKLAQDYDKSVINDYFEKLKSSAIITIVRLP